MINANRILMLLSIIGQYSIERGKKDFMKKRRKEMKLEKDGNN